MTISEKTFHSIALIPFNFVYAGRRCGNLPDGWTCEQQTVESGDVVTVIHHAADPATGLRLTVEVKRHRRHPVLEQQLWIENPTGRTTPLIEAVAAADVTFEFDSVPRLWHGIGEWAGDRNYSWSEEELAPGCAREFSPVGGRACDQAFPYFRLRGRRGGYALAVGWPGAWRAGFEAVSGGVRMTMGQKSLATVLRPGEKLRLPSLVILRFEGGETEAINQWRHWFRDQVEPRRDDGSLPRPRCCGYGRRSDGIEHCSETTETQIRYFDAFRAAGFPCDCWWVDAGWYECRRSPGQPPCRMDNGAEMIWYYTGVWQPDAQRFPEGLAPLADHLARHGAELLLWFEPERVYHADEFRDKPAHWLLDYPGNTSGCRLLNLADADCAADLGRRFSAFIERNHVGIYRQDFNIPPLPFWEAEDARQGADRIGITENLYNQHYLEFFDFLRSRHHGILIDSCASGGRRNDIETMRRAVPLHYSDYGYTDFAAKVRYHDMLAQWLMYYKDGSNYTAAPGVKSADWFAKVASLAPFQVICAAPAPGYDYTVDLEFERAARPARQLMLDGDYYRLSEIAGHPREVTIRQFHSPENGSGVLIVISGAESETNSVILRPAALPPDRTVEFTDLRTGVRLGAAPASAGLELAVTPRSAFLIEYRVVK